MLAATNPPRALAIALLPLLVAAIFQRNDADAIVYLGAGQRVLGPLDELEAKLDRHAIVLAARAGVRNAPPLAAFAADLAAGVFSRELIGFARGAVTDGLLGAWPRCFADRGDGGAAASARWLDEIPAISESVGIIRNPGYGLDPATLGRRRIAERAGLLEVDGCPARLIDFGELDPRDPPACFEGEGRARLSTKPALAALVDRHARELVGAGYERDADKRAGLDRLQDGARLTSITRGLVLEAIGDGALERSPFTEAGRKQLYTYLNTPAEQGRHVGLTRLHLAIWQASPELRASYPHLSGPDGAGYAGWLCTYGEAQQGLVPALLPPAPDLVFREADAHRHLLGPRWGVNVVGFFTAELGVGEAARLLMAGLDAHDIPALPIQGNLAPPSRQGAEHRRARPEQAAYPINIVCINGDGIPVFAREAGRSFFENRYTIALWWWEVGDPPADWRAAYEFVDEVWVATQQVYETLAPSCPVPVVKITLPVLEPEVAPVGRAQLGMPLDGFLFLYMHDYHSVAARKNPEGAIQAFRRAFEPGSGVKLLIKSINADKRPVEHERVALAAAAHPDIVLVDGYLSAAEKNAMLAACDCYVSLHRSEGFGLPVAEALLLERPVIATGFGGTQEFLDERDAFLVDFELAPVGEGASPYPADGIWAEPDLAHASTLMRAVVEHPEQAHERARRGRARLLELHSPTAAGASMERRLRHVREHLRERGAHTLDLANLPPLDSQMPDPSALESLIAGAPTVSIGTDRLAEARRKVIRPLLTWARDYAYHQRLVAGELNAQVSRLQSTLEDRIDDVARELLEAQQDLRAQLMASLETPRQPDGRSSAKPAGPGRGRVFA